MKYLKVLIMLTLCLTACTSKNKVNEIYMNFNKMDNFIAIEEEYINEVVNIVENEYIIPQEPEKDIDEFKDMDILFIKYSMDNKDYAITIYENGYGYIAEDDKVSYVKYNENTFNKLLKFINSK